MLSKPFNCSEVISIRVLVIYFNLSYWLVEASRAIIVKQCPLFSLNRASATYSRVDIMHKCILGKELECIVNQDIF